MRKIALEISDVSFTRFEQEIIRTINLTIYEGEFVILVGPNGSGKSSLIKIINGLIKPNNGKVLVTGRNIVGEPVHKVALQVATLTQDLQHSTFSDLSVLMNLRLALLRTRGLKQTHAHMVSYLASFNPLLPQRLDILAGHLSGGQRQALALAMCFAHVPKALLLDEHTSALDPKAADTLMALTNTHIREKKLTTIMITHSLEYALKYGDRIVAMAEGAIVADIAGLEKKNLSKEALIKLAY
jgi:putative ABC transport system ATP-binding protein